MKRQQNIQQPGRAIQLPLFEGHDPAPTFPLPETMPLTLEMSVSTESKEAYERRRVAEMAGKLKWPAMSLNPCGHWPGVQIAMGETVWHTTLTTATDSTIGLLAIELRKRLNPLTHESIDEKTGLCQYPVETLSLVEERLRARMIQLAKLLEWPSVSFWSPPIVLTIGPGEDIWQTYFVYGCFGTIVEAVEALERRLRGEPDKAQRTSLHQSCDEDED
jgi:hypothetical protein